MIIFIYENYHKLPFLRNLSRKISCSGTINKYLVDFLTVLIEMPYNQHLVYFFSINFPVLNFKT